MSCNTALLVEPEAGSADAAQPAHELKARVLVIDDDPRSARLLAAHLSASGYQLDTAATAHEAQQYVQQQRPDLIVCDVCLPDLDGVELTQWLRQAETTRDVPILMVTSLDDRKILARSLEAGADDFLTKPVHALELRTRVRSLLRNRIRTEELLALEAAATRCAAEPASALAPEFARVPCEVEPSLPTRVLLVEDDEQQYRLIQASLQGMACQLELAKNCHEALQIAERQPPDLVLLDLILPDGDGYEVIESLRRMPQLAQVPILVISSIRDVRERVKALDLGADDFIVKGSERIELEARIRRVMRWKRSFDQLSNRCDHALRQAATDSLTGLLTHGCLQETLHRQASLALRHGWPLSLLFVDIDHFKQINDQHGHAFGDDVLRRLAEQISSSRRASDAAFRYGGEEFVMLLPHTARASAQEIAERIRAEVERLTLSATGSNNVRPTVSIGVASLPEDAADAATLLQRADEAMYRAKQAGRNRVAVFGSGSQPSSNRGRILLVDDDERNLRLLEAHLKPEGYELIKARDGIEAIEIARHTPPDLILLDAMMPRLTGFDACRRLKQESATSLIPVVLVTALSGRDHKLRGIEAGADDFLTKPIDRTELLARTKALLRAKRSTDALEDAETVILMLAKAVENRDPSTGGHVERVARYASLLGQALNLPESQIDGLRRAGFVHDIGKIAIPDAVLLKPGRLTPEERKIVETHAEVGYEMLRSVRTFRESLPAVRFHHERLNGSGYPLGLRGDQVPLVAQIMGIVDVFDALSNDRVYRPAMSLDASFAVLHDEAERGLHDPKLIAIFEKLIRAERS